MSGVKGSSQVLVMHSTEASLNSCLKDISGKSLSVLFFHDRALVSTMAGRGGWRLRCWYRANTPAWTPMSWVRVKSVPFCVCMLSHDKSLKKYKSLCRYSQFTVCRMCCKSLRSNVYTHTVLLNNRTNRIAQTITHCHFMLLFTGAILHSTQTKWPSLTWYKDKMTITHIAHR